MFMHPTDTPAIEVEMFHSGITIPNNYKHYADSPAIEISDIKKK
jgi:hypothetical protein